MMTWTFECEQLELDLLLEEVRLGSQPGHLPSALGCMLEELLQNSWTRNIPVLLQASPTSTFALSGPFQKGGKTHNRRKRFQLSGEIEYPLKNCHNGSKGQMD